MTTPPADHQTSRSPTGRASDSANVDFIAKLTRLATEPFADSEFLEAACSLLAQYFGAPLATARLGSSRQHWAASEQGLDAWLQVTETLLREVLSEAAPLARVIKVDTAEGDTVGFAAPIRLGHTDATVHGGLCLVTRVASPEIARAMLSEFYALVGIVDASLLARRLAADSPAELVMPEVDAASQAAAFTNLTEFAFSIVNRTTRELGCEQAALGIARRNRIQVLAVSGIDEPELRAPGTLDMRQAMEECLDHGSTIHVHCGQADDNVQPSQPFELHQRWHEQTSRSTILTLPLICDDQVVGVLSLRRSSYQPFRKIEIRQITTSIAPIGATMPILERAGRGPLRHLTDSAREAFRWAVTGRGHLLVRCKLFAALALLGWFLFGTMQHEIVVPASLQAREILHLASPYEAELAESLVQAGDVILAGQVLYRFDTAELELTRIELIADVGALDVEIDQALSQRELSTANLSAARRNISQAKLAKIERRIAAATVRAPFDGVVLTGNLHQRIGQRFPQGEPLLSLRKGSQADLVLELQLPERFAPEVDASALAMFASNARPEQVHRYGIDRLRPAAEQVEGRNVFLAHASPRIDLSDADRPPTADSAEWLRVGMKGTAKLNLGSKPVWRLALARVLNFLHRGFWL